MWVHECVGDVVIVILDMFKQYTAVVTFTSQ